MAASHSHRATLSMLAAVLLLFISFAATATGAPSSAVGSSGDGSKGGMTHLHFYMHEIFGGGPNGTLARVAPPARGDGSQFGFISVLDDILREGADPASRLIGRAQGLAAGTSLNDDRVVTTMLNFVFTDGPHNGSTLAAFGLGLIGTVMERPVIGGTGVFRMARGYTLSRAVNSSDPNNHVALEYDVYVSL